MHHPFLAMTHAVWCRRSPVAQLLQTLTYGFSDTISQPALQAQHDDQVSVPFFLLAEMFPFFSGDCLEQQIHPAVKTIGVFSGSFVGTSF